MTEPDILPCSTNITKGRKTPYVLTHCLAQDRIRHDDGRLEVVERCLTCSHRVVSWERWKPLPSQDPDAVAYREELAQRRANREIVVREVQPFQRRDEAHRFYAKVLSDDDFHHTRF